MILLKITTLYLFIESTSQKHHPSPNGDLRSPDRSASWWHAPSCFPPKTPLMCRKFCQMCPLFVLNDCLWPWIKKGLLTPLGDWERRAPCSVFDIPPENHEWSDADPNWQNWQGIPGGYPYEASIIDLCPVSGHWCVVHWLHLCRVVGHAGGEQDGGQSTTPVFLSPSNSVVLLKYANHSGKGWCCRMFNEGSTGWKVSRFHLAFVPENGGSTCNAWPFFLHHQNVGHHIFRETNVLPTIPTLAVISATSIRWQDRGPLFPGSSCFPLSPDHKHKRGKLRMIPDLGEGQYLWPNRTIGIWG